MPTLNSIALTPTRPSTPRGTTVQFTATGTYSDSSTHDLTTAVLWTSSKTTVSTISNTPPTQGLAHALATGKTKISASLTGLRASTRLTVNP